MARNSAKNSAKFALELSIRAQAECSSGTTASGNLVVDRTEIERISKAKSAYPGTDLSHW